MEGCNCRNVHCSYRERHAMDLENRSRYSALKARWATLDAVVAKEYVPPHELFYMEGDDNKDEESPDMVSSEDEALVQMLDITGKVGSSSLNMLFSLIFLSDTLMCTYIHTCVCTRVCA